MNLNEFQQQAVNEPPKNITVSAAAGSGKTQVLGARVLSRISGDEPVDVSRLLIVTFTRAAAAEMRSRISRAVTDALKTETDPSRRRNLERQLSLVGGADICTIDSFCYRLLKQNFFRVPGLSSDFSLGSEAQLRDISAEALRECVEMFSAALEEMRGGELNAHYRQRAGELRCLYPEGLEGILEGYALLSENYGSAKRTNDFVTADQKNWSTDYIEFVRKIERLLSSVPDPEAWLKQRERDYDPELPFDETPLGRFVVDMAAVFLADIEKKLSDELACGGLSPQNINTFTKTLENVRAISVPRSYARAREIFTRKFPVEGQVQSADKKDSPGNPHASDVMKAVKKIWKKTGELFETSVEDIELFRKKLSPAVAALCAMTRLSLKLEREKMLEKKRLSFSACVSLALELLTDEKGGPSETALELREYYDEIYVDEAQDIDPRQLALFEAISNGRLFMVGDVKQSIYGFRQAEPEIFNSRCHDGENSRLITMNINYRSNNAVISAVNQVFSRLMNRDTMRVDYHKEHSMRRGESWLPKPSRAEFLAIIDSETKRRYKPVPEAQEIANRISRLIASGQPVYDKDTGKHRPVEYRDIIVLSRKNKDGPILEQAMIDNGIPCYLDGGRGLYAQEEISAVVDVLRLIDNPLRDIPLAATLRGLMFCFGENDLLKIRAVSLNRSFSEVFAALSDAENPRHDEYACRMADPGLLERCLNVGAFLKKWRREASFRPVSEVISSVLTDTGYYSSVGALPSGGGRRANLDLLTDAAASFEASGSRGLYSFIDYIEKQELSGGSSETEAKTLSDSMNVVRIMTFHKSKGLEAPVVILFKCSAWFRQEAEPMTLSRELGFSFDYLNETDGYRYKSPLSPLIGLENRIRERTEEIRLLYVAMTRPREVLICTGYFCNEGAAQSALSFDADSTSSDVAYLIDSRAGMLGGAVNDQRYWKYEAIAVNDVKGPTLSQKLHSAAAFNEDVLETAANLLGFSYNYAAAGNIPAKVSVSAIKAEDQDNGVKPMDFAADTSRHLRTPAFMGGKETVTGAELGTAYHAVMENLDLFGPVTPQIDELEKRGIISPGQRKLIRDEKITQLLSSPIGIRMKKAKRLWRESPFMISVPASEIEGADAPPGETVAVQGVIDCFFEDEDGITLVDYKSDYYTDPDEIVKRYKKQLLYYTKAIKMKFSDKKIQKYLYLFHKGDIIEV